VWVGHRVVRKSASCTTTETRLITVCLYLRSDSSAFCSADLWSRMSTCVAQPRNDGVGGVAGPATICEPRNPINEHRAYTGWWMTDCATVDIHLHSYRDEKQHRLTTTRCRRWSGFSFKQVRDSYRHNGPQTSIRTRRRSKPSEYEKLQS
jgi:hypothetical protein